MMGMGARLNRLRPYTNRDEGRTVTRV
ncbi:hypothetical protein EMIT0324P_170016 [Pseudomonas chlororaphis]